MKANSIKKEEYGNIESYKEKMSSIEFLQQYVEDPNIFQSNTSQFKNFLCQSFAHLHSNFHYLTFLNNEDIDKELVRASEILQILPQNSKRLKLFDNMTEMEIHKFWLRFFSLFDIKNTEFNFDTIFSLSWENKIDFLKSMNDTLHYSKYDFPVVNSKKLKDADLNKEIEMWNTQVPPSIITFNESSAYEDTKEISNLNIQNLIIDLKQVVTMYNNLKKIEEKYEPFYHDFIKDFIILVKNVIKYKNDVNIIDSSFLDILYNKMVTETEYDLSSNLYFIKRCNNLIKILKAKIKALN